VSVLGVTNMAAAGLFAIALIELMEVIRTMKKYGWDHDKFLFNASLQEIIAFKAHMCCFAITLTLTLTLAASGVK
jgi:hypothetical protein